AVREVREELGITLNGPAERILRLEATPETGWEFCWVYRARHEGPFLLQVSEVRGGGWFTPETIRAWMTARPDDFASCFRVLWGRLHP
ncbi:MAG: NUDIX hydrolase, partial [Verrucomicrobiales bacterium]|nr:NUDIX hydrolase [Verrucomicrobiales bacterium]